MTEENLIPVYFSENTNLEAFGKSLEEVGLKLIFNQKEKRFEVNPIEKEPAKEAG